MRARILSISICALVTTSSASAHGPQIQITSDGGKIVTRELHLNGPYSNALTAPKSVYVMPMMQLGGVWYSQPNTAIDPILMQPTYTSGPGFAYGYDLIDGGPQAFSAGSLISAGFTAGLKRWDGAAFADAGVTEFKAFRGSNPEITAPAANFAITSDVSPFDTVSLATVLADYGTDAAEIHGTFRFALLGDGATPTSASADGVYLVSLQASSTQVGLAPSDPYYFVLNKNAPWSTVATAVDSLGVAPTLQQWLVPEPSGFHVTLLAAAGLCPFSNRNRGKR